jgi:hypothetical protein
MDPLIIGLTVAYFLVASIGTFDLRLTQAKRDGTLPPDEPDRPGWVVIFDWLMWGIWLALLYLNWKYALVLFGIKFVLKLLTVLETIGNILMAPFKPRKMKYQVVVDDNFHYMDESERYTHGEYEASEMALGVAKALVDADLNSLYRTGMTADELYRQYTTFGSDPRILSEDESCHFSAWSYAQERCQDICKEVAQSDGDT